MEQYRQQLLDCYKYAHNNIVENKIIRRCINILGISCESDDLFHLARNKNNLYIMLERLYFYKYASSMHISGYEFNIIYCIVEKFNMCLSKHDSLNIILDMIHNIIMYPENAIIYDDFYTNCLRIMT